MKKFENPMLQVVSISKKDIIATSEKVGFGSSYSGGAIEAADRFRDWEDF